MIKSENMNHLPENYKRLIESVLEKLTPIGSIRFYPSRFANETKIILRWEDGLHAEFTLAGDSSQSYVIGVLGRIVSQYNRNRIIQIVKNFDNEENQKET